VSRARSSSGRAAKGTDPRPAGVAGRPLSVRRVRSHLPHSHNTAFRLSLSPLPSSSKVSSPFCVVPEQTCRLWSDVVRVPSIRRLPPRYYQIAHEIVPDCRHGLKVGATHQVQDAEHLPLRLVAHRSGQPPAACPPLSRSAASWGAISPLAFRPYESPRRRGLYVEGRLGASDSSLDSSSPGGPALVGLLRGHRLTRVAPACSPPLAPGRVVWQRDGDGQFKRGWVFPAVRPRGGLQLVERVKEPEKVTDKASTWCQE
jgi:hypothetical protein